jgi:hypothetical protein
MFIPDICRMKIYSPAVPSTTLKSLPLACVLLVIHALCNLVFGSDIVSKPGTNAFIRHITIVPLPIFNERKPGERKRLFRLANSLHIKTQLATIRAQLLFKEGDRYQERELRETERNLRRLRFVREPQIRIVAIDGDQVDIEVQTTDVWSLAPTIAISRSGGSNRSAIGIEDVNFLGLGKVINVEFVKDRERTRNLVAYKDPNLGFGRWTLDAIVSSNSDGHLIDFNVQKPFYSLQAQSSFALTLSDQDSLLRRYALGDEVGRFQARHQQLELRAGSSPGLVNGWAQRFSYGAAFERARFAPDGSNVSAGRLPSDRKYIYPFAEWEVLQDDFATTTNKDQIGRTEDEAFGQRYLMRAGLASQHLGSLKSAAIFQLEASNGFRLNNDQSLFVKANTQARVASGTPENASIAGELRYFWRHNDYHTSYVALQGNYGRRLDFDQQLLLGGDNGLRAYPIAFQTGEQSALLTLEQRRFTNYRPLQLFSLGAAVFADVGRVWGSDAAGGRRLSTLKDVGVGLRLGNLRSARANMLHLDVSFPLDDPRGASPQFSVETRTRF